MSEILRSSATIDAGEIQYDSQVALSTVDLVGDVERILGGKVIIANANGSSMFFNDLPNTIRIRTRILSQRNGSRYK